MPQITAGEFPITINGEEFILKTSPKAITAISRMHNGLGGAREGIFAQNFDAILSVIRHGANLNDQQVKHLDKKVYANGLTTDLIVGLAKYIGALGNGGRPLNIGGDDDDDAATGDAADEGNG